MNTSTLTVEDKNIEIAKNAANDAAADGAGITVDSGDGNKTWNWIDSTDSWTSSEHINLATGKGYKLNGTTVLSGTTLGSSIVTSSLTTLGTITTGEWNGTAIANNYLANSTVSFGGVSVALGAADATPAFNLSDATGYQFSSLTGITTDIVGDATPQLGGNLDANSKDISGVNNLNVSGVSTFASDVNATDIIKGYKYTAAPYGSTTTITVTVASKTAAHRYNGTGSSLGYVFDGLESPFITLTPGRTYKFDQADNSNSSHQIKFYLEADKTTLYEGGVTYNGTAGSAGAYTQIVVGDETPTVLHYMCVNHGYMGNSAQVNSNVVNTNYDATLRGNLNVSGIATATTFSGSGANLTNLPAANITGTLPAISGVNLTGVVTSITAGSNITLTGGPAGAITIAASGGGGGGGDTVSIESSATDILSVSSGAISADDAGADKLVFWDDSAGKLTYLTVGSNLTVTNTTIAASGGGGGGGGGSNGFAVIAGMIF